MISFKELSSQLMFLGVTYSHYQNSKFCFPYSVVLVLLVLKSFGKETTLSANAYCGTQILFTKIDLD